MSEMLISIKGLHKYFGKNEVLKGIDLDIKSGEVVVIIGPSGSGKSTFLRTMNLLETPTKGMITFEGVDITDKKNDIFKMREKMGMVFQQFNLFPNMTVLENITLSPTKTKGISKAEAEAKAYDLLDKVGLRDKSDVYPASLSGGQQQRIAIARGLAMDPDVLLFDEPTSALDPISAGKIEDTLYDLKDKYTMLIVTRSMQQASRISDRTGFFLDGDLIEYGKTHEMFMEPKCKETEDYITGKFG